jgi:RimJ/RimL family protein N-acetyltransferase
MAMWQDERVYRHISGKPGTREECWGRLMRYLGHWHLKGFGYWLVEEKATGAFVGEVGFADFLREMEPAIDGSLEGGWVLSPEHHGQRYGTEAVTAGLDWVRTHFPALPVTCIIHPENAASIALAKKCGFTERCIGTYKDEEALVMDLLTSS